MVGKGYLRWFLLLSSGWNDELIGMKPEKIIVS